MGGAPYKSAKEGGGRSFDRERPRHDLKPSKQIIGHKIMYNGITSGFEVES